MSANVNSGNRVAIVLAAVMFASILLASYARPTIKASAQREVVALDAMVPHEFGDWREEPQRVTQVVNPATQELLDKLYSQILTRTYVNREGYRIMLSVAYGSDQRERSTLQAHKPEVCYPAQGFTLRSNQQGVLATKFGDIPVTRLFTSMGTRYEPVTYWFTIGRTAVQGVLQRRLVQLRYGLTGEIPDGVLFRVSSLDTERDHAFEVHQRFVNQLLETARPADRLRLSGLGAP